MVAIRALVIGFLATAGSVAATGGVAAQEPEPEVISRAEAALSRGDAETAARLLELALEERGESSRLLFYLGRAYLEQGRAAEAAQALRRARTLAPGAPVAVEFWEGVALQRLGDVAGARARFAAVLAVEPDSEPARLQLAWILLTEERPGEAAELLQGVVQDHPGSPLAWYYLGLAHHGSTRLDAARDAYRRAVELDPGLAGAHVVLGRVQRELGEAAEARVSLERALELDPDSADAGFELGRLELESGNAETAVARLEAAVAADPGHAAARYQLGLAYRRLGRVPESEAMLAGHQALESEERRRQRRALGGVAAQSTYERALELLAAGRFDEAADAFRATVEAAGEDATAAAWLGLGSACLESGDDDCAVDALRRAVDLDSGLTAARLLLARALTDAGRTEEARAVLDELRARRDQDGARPY